MTRAPIRLTLAAAALAAVTPAAAQEKFNAVTRGKEVFAAMGCIECHVTEKNDTSMKTGPNLYGLFLTQPRQREVGPAGSREMVKADQSYFQKSVRRSWDDLAVAESGPTKGATYLKIMPQYSEEMLPAQNLESLWHYLRTLADPGQAGPAKVMLTQEKEAAITNAWDIPGEIIVTTRPRVFRALLQGTSGRALHVGLPNGMNYSFDTRMLSVRRVWSGGFLNLQKEWQGRGGQPSSPGQHANILLENEPVLAPLTRDGNIVDFEFKEPDALDIAAIEKHLWDDTDFSTRLANLDAEFLGHQLAPGTGHPSFRFRVGKNTFSQSVTLSGDGYIEITLTGKIARSQKFRLRRSGLGQPEVSGGKLHHGEWTLAPSATSETYRLKAKLPNGFVARAPVDPRTGPQEDWSPQALVSTPAQVEKPDPQKRRKHGKPLAVQAGYSIRTWQPPVDLYGRKQLFAATGIAVAKDGTVVFATRASGIWRLRDGHWSLFAEGTFEALGVCIEDDHGDQIVITQKPELTRITDTNGDGRADTFETVCDDFGFHGNYHEYTHGPVRDQDGNYYFNLNLAHQDKNPRASWRAGGKFMGTMGGYRGWSCRVTPDGKFEPFASGLRSPAGMGVAPDGRIWYAENQGEYVGSSKWVPLEQGKFYGHPSGLVDLPGINPDSPIDYKKWAAQLRKGAVWLPHNLIANSPGNPAWDTTGGKFGGYQGQVFLGDQTLSQLFRVVTEQVNGVDQGCAIPFAQGLQSGIMRPCFLPDGSLLMGQTGRGWYAVGGHAASLQQIIWDGKTRPGDIHRVTSSRRGFTIHLTAPLAPSITAGQVNNALTVKSWFYTNNHNYGSPQHDERDDSVASVEISAGRKAIRLNLTGFGNDSRWLDRIYHIHLKDTRNSFANTQAWDNLEAYFTLRAIPE